MKTYLPLLLLLLVGCKEEKKQADFVGDLNQLQNYFHIPGMAALVKQGDETLLENYSGYADWENKVPMDSTTLVPMASLTKMFTGMLLIPLAENGVLENPINKYLDAGVGDSVIVEHIATHTSQGQVGKHFHYSYRYGWLTNVIEKEYNMPFDQAINISIIDRFGLRNTFLLKDSLHGRNVARPYFFEGEIKPGFIDYGYSASSGIVSTVRDLAKFSKLIDAPSIRTGIDKVDSFYKFGLFSQNIEGNKIFWAYGQYDCYSSLFIKVPDRDLTLVLAANNNLMSDPARLIYGDITTSLFALAFFKHYLNIDLPAGQLRAQAVAESFMARYDVARAEKSKELLREVFKSNDYRTLTTMHNISFLKEVAKYNDQPPFVEFDSQLKSIGNKLLSVDADNPYANYYMANCYESSNTDSARFYYQRIAGAKNFSRFWYTNEAEKWLKQNASSASGKEAQPPK